MTESANRASPQPDVPAWVKDAVFYQIVPDRFHNGDPRNDPPGAEPWGGRSTAHNYFGGDLAGILQKLDYLAELGVTALYLTPIFDADRNHKYHTRDYLKIDPHFGDEAGFAALVADCHRRDMRILLDAVFNHTGVDFFAFADLKASGASSRYADWYSVHGYPVGSEEQPNYACWAGVGALPELRHENAAVKEYLFAVTRHWMRFGIDGWRLDAPQRLPAAFWREWRELVRGINPDAFLVGELWEEASEYLRGDQFDAVMNYRFRRACKKLAAAPPPPLSTVVTQLAEQRTSYADPINLALLNVLGSHDTERLRNLCGHDPGLVRLLVFLQVTYVGVPMIYYGDEVAMAGGPDPDCRGPMVWDEGRQDRELLGYYQGLIRLRHQLAALRRGGIETVLVDDERRIWVFLRQYEGELVYVALNADTRPHGLTLPLPEGQAGLDFRLRWPEGRSAAAVTPAALSVELLPRSGAVLVAHALHRHRPL